MSSFMKLYWNEYRIYQQELLDEHCFNGSALWKVLPICLEGELDWIGLLFGIASILSVGFAHLIITIQTMTGNLEQRRCVLSFLISLVDLPATVLSYQLITQILFSITSMILTVGFYIICKLNRPGIYRYGQTWKEISRRLSFMCGAIFIIFIAIFCDTIFILTINTTSSTQSTYKGGYCKPRYTIGMVMGYLQVLLTLVSAVLSKQTCNTPQMAVADIFYIISVSCSIRSLQHCYHATPWMLARCSSIIEQIIIAICRKRRENQNFENKIGNVEDKEDLQSLLSNDITKDDNSQEFKSKHNGVVVDENLLKPFKNRRLSEIKEGFYSNCYQVNTDSTTTSFTGDQDFETESTVEKQKMTRSTLNHRRSSFQLHLSLLATESKSERIAQWFETSTPEDDMPSYVREDTDTKLLSLLNVDKDRDLILE